MPKPPSGNNPYFTFRATADGVLKQLVDTTLFAIFYSMYAAFLLSLALMASSGPDHRLPANGHGPVFIAEDDPSPLEDMEDTRSIIRGVVAEVIKSDKVVRLNLGAKSPGQRFAAVVFPDHFSAFPNLEQWEGRTVQIRGPVSEFGGRPQIILTSPKQLAELPGARPKAADIAPRTTGQQATIRGVVAEVLKTPSVIRIHLGAKFPDRRAAAVIYPDHFTNFAEVDKLVGKPVEISGDALDLPECPHVLLTAATQIQVIVAQIAGGAEADIPDKLTGRQGVVRGEVAEIIKSDKLIRLNLGEKAPHQRASAVVYARDFAAFPDLSRWEGKAVEISGDLAEYGGREQIVMRKAGQIALLETGKKP